MAKRSADDASSGQNAKKVRGPDEVAVKFLLPNVVVGALLSRKAAALKRIRDQTCYSKDFVLKLSGKDQFYPGTSNERMIALVGPYPLVHRACCLLQDHIIDDPFLVTDEAGTNDLGPRQGQLKFAVRDRAASKIIGNKGAVVKDISNHFNIAITITPSKEVVVPDERVVTVLGPSRNVFDALEAIMHQISLQQTHVSPEFDYYEQYNKPKEDEGEKVAAEKVGDDTEVTEEAKKEEAEKEEVVKEETVEIKIEIKEEVPEEESKPEEAKSEEIEGSNEEKDKETEEKPSEPESKPETEDKPTEKKESSEEKVKKLLKDPRKDGKWTWQTDRNNRRKWVWVENQKTPIHYNHSPQGQGYRGNYRGGYRPRARGGRQWH